jgi:ATP-binding cassette subfamily A (ABC1) protein 3
LIVEYRVFNGIIYYIRGFFNGNLPLDIHVDTDVKAEKERVTAMTKDDLKANNLVLNQVSKFYGKFLAVNQISIGIEQ